MTIHIPYVALCFHTHSLFYISIHSLYVSLYVHSYSPYVIRNMYGHQKKYKEYVWKCNETYRTCMEIYGDILHIHVNTMKFREYVWKYNETYGIGMDI